MTPTPHKLSKPTYRIYGYLYDDTATASRKAAIDAHLDFQSYIDKALRTLTGLPPRQYRRATRGPSR